MQLTVSSQSSLQSLLQWRPVVSLGLEPTVKLAVPVSRVRSGCSVYILTLPLGSVSISWTRSTVHNAKWITVFQCLLNAVDGSQTVVRTSQYTIQKYYFSSPVYSVAAQFSRLCSSTVTRCPRGSEPRVTSTVAVSISSSSAVLWTVMARAVCSVPSV